MNYISFHTPIHYQQKFCVIYWSCIVAVIFTLFCSQPIKAKIHKWVDENGKVHYGDKPPKNQPSLQKRQLNSATLATSKVSRGPQNSLVLRIRDHFTRQEFAAVEQILSQLQKQARHNIANETEFVVSFRAFELNDITQLSLFDQWLNLSPNNYFARIAKARFYFQLGWTARGTKTVNNTSDAQFAKMKEYFLKTESELRRALAINPNSILPYLMRIEMAGSENNQQQKQASLTQGLKINPNSYELRKTFMHYLQPRWGGSIEAMRIFAESAQFNAKKNPKLKLLLGAPDAAIARTAYDRKQYAKAITKLNSASQFGKDPEVFFWRAKAYYRQGKYPQALTDFNTSIRINPEIADYYRMRHFAFIKVAKFDKALSDIKKAALLEPNNSRNDDLVISAVGRAGKSKGSLSDFDQKLMALDSKITAEPNNPHHYFKKGHYLLSSKLYLRSEAPLRQAIKMAPTQFEYYRAIDLALFKQRKLDVIIEFWDQYINLRPIDGRAYLERAGTYYHMRDYERSKVDAKKAMDLGINNAKALYDKLQSL